MLSSKEKSSMSGCTAGACLTEKAVFITWTMVARKSCGNWAEFKMEDEVEGKVC